MEPRSHGSITYFQISLQDGTVVAITTRFWSECDVILEIFSSINLFSSFCIIHTFQVIVDSELFRSIRTDRVAFQYKTDRYG
jgi:hypothetical protein